MPYLMGGFPDLAASRAIGEAYADGGADLVELGVPFSDPLADGPVIHAAGTAALRGGRDASTACSSVGAALADARPGRAHVLRQPRARARPRALRARRSPSAGISGLIVPDLPLEEARRRARGLRRGRASRSCRSSRRRRPTSGSRAIGARARGFVYTVSVTGTTGERAALADGLAGIVARAKAHTDVPVALGFGIATPEQAAGGRGAGADGVIVGSRGSCARPPRRPTRRARRRRVRRALAPRLRCAGASRPAPPVRSGDLPPAMGLVLTTTSPASSSGSSCWAIGVKSFDAFLSRS